MINIESKLKSIETSKAKAKAYREQNKDRLKALQKAWYEKNKACPDRNPAPTHEEKLEYMRQWRERNKEEIAAKRKAKYETNRTKPARSRQSQDSIREKQREYYEKNAEVLREKARLNRLKLTPEKKLEYRKRGKAVFRKSRDAKMAEIAGRPRAEVCEIPSCGKTGAGRSENAKTNFDHDHQTGEFRGWLCNRCNLTAGKFEEDPQVLRELADYLDLHNLKRNKENHGSVPDESPL